MGKRYIFRADGNARIGVGHIMRSMTIADSLAAKVGEDAVLFVCADEESARVARGRGFDVKVLGTDFTRMEDELDKWDEVINCNKEDAKEADSKNTKGENPLNTVILVDSYQVTNNYLEGMHKYGKVVMMDDLQSTKYPVDAVINYNIFADLKKYEALYGKLDNCYLGSAYIPVRPQFINVDYETRKEVMDVLITTGGADSMNIAGAIFETLSMAGIERGRNIRFHIVSGVYSPFFSELKEKARCKDNLVVYQNVTEMADLMKKCDVAITAGGSTIYELAAIGVPFICFSYADNQVPAVEYIGATGIAINAGAYDKDPAGVLANISKAFWEQYSDTEYRRLSSEKEKKLVDGQGASRIADVLVGL